jgi:transcriptional regulator with XRE-family HTH domain
LPLTNIDNTATFHESIATFGDRLTAARDAKGLTTASLAQKLGVDVATMEIWENDTDMPRANRIQMLAGMLNVSIIWLISGEGNGTTNIADNYERPTAINDAIGEITQLKDTLTAALEKLEALEQRLQDS